MAKFDSMQRNMVNKVNNLYGDSCIWNPSDSSPQQTASVLFKDPTREMELSGVEYSPLNFLIEYNILDLIGLRDLANDNQNEIITVKGVEYYVRQVNLKYDGKTCIAVCEEKH
jgi:hypothetical protein